MTKLLENKTILVTGAGGLLGTNLIAAILSHGANVIATDIDVDIMSEKLTATGVDINQNNVTIDKLDITNEEDVKKFFTLTDNIDGAVNTAYPRNKKYGSHFFDVTLDSFNENINLHLGSAFLFNQQCAAYFNRHKKPFSLINISSIYGVIAPRFDIYENTPMTMPVEYSAIKSAIQHLSKYITAYVDDSRFRINCVSPGGIFDHQPKLFLEAYKSLTHGAGMLDVKDITGSIIFLLSDLSQYVTGQNIIVDDGFSL
ncbi:oxidoreductase [Morganella morganii]|uniref:oxidoreductase n=1 Tax=Morganella morganii TaxID=582 RepID=UPI001BDB47EB|nr:oxidoreductase [Morganella morganii]ELT0453947.1 SDR family oxidoreductase [Morganella morganii]MBT0337664.1 SDR family oxidoreductase [Morganella morganii subsp. morganii]